MSWFSQVILMWLLAHSDQGFNMCPHDHRLKLFILTIHLFIKLFSMEILVLRILIVCLVGPVHTTYFEIWNISKIQEKVPTRTAGLSILLNIASYSMGTTETCYVTRHKCVWLKGMDTILMYKLTDYLPVFQYVTNAQY